MLKLMEKLLLPFKKYLFWSVVGLFTFIPLYPKFPLISVPGTYVAVRLEDFLIATVVMGWFLIRLPTFKDVLSKTITRSFLLFWAVGLLSLLSALAITHTISPHLGMLHFLRRIELMMLFFVAFDAIKNIKQVELLLKIMLWVTALIIIYGFGQQWLSFPVVSTMNKEFSKGLILFLTPGARVNSTFAGHYDLAAYLSLFLTFAAAMWLYFKQLKKRLVITLISILSFILLSMTAARVSFVAALGGVAVIFWLSGQKKLIFFLIGLSFFIFAISPDLRHRTIATLTVNLLGGGGAKYTPPPQDPNSHKTFSIENAASGAATPSAAPVDISPGEPVNSTELGVFRSFEIRTQVEWPRSLRAFLKNPFLGSGYSSINIATDNDLLRSLGETGILGTLSSALIWYLIIKTILINRKKSIKDFSFYFLTGTFVGVIVLFANSLFIDILESSKVASLSWLFLGVTFALIRLKYE